MRTKQGRKTEELLDLMQHVEADVSVSKRLKRVREGRHQDGTGAVPDYSPPTGTANNYC